MTAAEIKAKNTVRSVLQSHGITIISGHGKDDKCLCPFHKDKSPSLEITKTGLDLWVCRAGCGGGDVIDLLAQFKGKTAREYLLESNKDAPQSNGKGSTARLNAKEVQVPHPIEKSPFEGPLPKKSELTEICAYEYHDANGNYAYESVRYEPKTFKQRVRKGTGFTWSMDGVERVPYRLPEVRRSKEVWIVEGEKDADALCSIGLVATCNVGGAKKWLESYAEYFIDKDLVLCGDNDKPGQEHMEMVRKSCEPVARSIRLLKVPSGKDISEFTEGLSDGEALDACNKLKASVEPLYQGENLPLKSMADLEIAYIENIRRDLDRCLDFGKWLPALEKNKLVAGEMAVILAETGVGKSAILTNIALCHPDLSTVYFHLELSDQKVFERSAQTASKISRDAIRSCYLRGERIDWQTGKKLDHVLFCTDPRIHLDRMSSIVRRSELRFGSRPSVVLVDYVQLMKATTKQSRYERFTDIAEGLKMLAKELSVVVVIASQVSRGPKDEKRKFGEMHISDAKDSGAIENSCSLLLGASRLQERPNDVCVQVLKSTETGGGLRILADYDFQSLRITQKGLM
jgi:hypothetical protein